MASLRIERINEELKRQIGRIINNEVKNSNITGMITVTKVKTTPDLRYARVYVSIYGSKNLKLTFESLSKVGKFIRSRIANSVNLRMTPEIIFVHDDSEITGGRIDEILKEIKENDKRIKGENNDD